MQFSTLSCKGGVVIIKCTLIWFLNKVQESELLLYHFQKNQIDSWKE